MANSRRIDVHAHIVPPHYRKWLLDKGMDAGGAPLPEWRLDAALENMNDNEIEIAILSVSTPGVEPARQAEASALARDLNEYSARVVVDNSRRFGFFATVAMSDIDESIAETIYALDVLKADGVIFPAHFKGTYLGDPRFDPLMAEINRRRSVLFVHPSEMPSDRVAGLPPYAADFLLDTVRAAVNLSRSGVMDRYPNIKFLLSNAGGFLPYAAWRIASVASPRGDPEDGLRLLRRFYFETSLSTTKYALPSLLSFAQPTHVVFGSDFPYASSAAAEFFASKLEDYDPDNLPAINRLNAEKLFPRACGAATP